MVKVKMYSYLSNTDHIFIIFPAKTDCLWKSPDSKSPYFCRPIENPQKGALKIPLYKNFSKDKILTG